MVDKPKNPYNKKGQRTGQLDKIPNKYKKQKIRRFMSATQKPDL